MIAAQTWALGGQSGSGSRVWSGYSSGNGPRRERKATVGVCHRFNTEGHCGYASFSTSVLPVGAVIRPRCVRA